MPATRIRDQQGREHSSWNEMEKIPLCERLACLESFSFRHSKVQSRMYPNNFSRTAS